MTASREFHGEIKQFDRITAVLQLEAIAATTDGRKKVVTPGMILQAKRDYENCTCEDHGLRPGLSREELNHLSAGCCSSTINPGRGWICPTLVRIRKAMEA
jgi:hypothetical protein